MELAERWMLGNKGLTPGLKYNDTQLTTRLATLTAPFLAPLALLTLRLIVSASSDKTLRMWDARSDSSKRILKGHSDVVYSCAFSPDGNTIISSSEDTTIRLWSAHEGHVIFVYKGHTSAVLSARFSPGGRYIVSASDYGEREIKLWHARMPVVRRPKRLGQRVFFTKAGLIKNIIFTEEPGEDFFREPDSDEENDIVQMLRQDEAGGEDEESAATEGEGPDGPAAGKDKVSTTARRRAGEARLGTST
jgi:hypothetical protein